METLIKDEAGLKAILGGVQSQITWETMAPFVKQAETEYILPAIGEAFYTELVSYVGNNVTVTSLIDRLSIASGYYALAIGAPQLIVSIGDAGAAINVQGGMQAMGKWVYVELRDSSLSKADRALEDALQYLEAHKDDEDGGSSIFGTWTSSALFTITKELFISSATELTKYFPAARNSRRIYLALRDYIVRGMDDYIEPLISPEYYEVLKAKLADANATWDAKELTLLRYIRTALAHYAFAEGIAYLNLDKDFRLVSKTDGLENADALKPKDKNVLLLDCKEKMDKYSVKFRQHLDKYAEDGGLFAEYYASDVFTAPEDTKPYYRYQNDDPDRSYILL